MPRREFTRDTQLTAQDRAVLRFVKSYVEAHGRAPSLRAIQDGMKWRSHGPAQRHVDALVATGQLKKDYRGAVTVPGRKSRGPFLAEVVGGEVDEWVPAPGAALVAWRVTEAAAGFIAGDVVFADPSYQAKVGDVVLGKVFVSALGGVRNMEFVIRKVEGQIVRGSRGREDEERIPGYRDVQIVGPIRYLQRELLDAGRPRRV